MATTDLATIETALKAAIVNITPRITQQQVAAKWKPYVGERDPAAASRWFRFVWEPVGHGEWMGPASVETVANLHLVVDYGGIPEHLVARDYIEDDRYQLRDILNRLKDTLAGLRWFEAIGWRFTEKSTPDQAQVDLTYVVRYMKARA